MKKSILLLFAALLPLMASAEKVEIDGIWYNLIPKAKLAEVTYKGNSYDSYNEYSGSITIPATITYDGKEYSVTSIGNSAFKDCSGLTDITIPEGVTSIGSSAFSSCSSLTSITIPESVTSIGEWVFFRCSNLDSITLPKGITSIGKSTFMDCSSLITIIIPENVTSIGDHAFWDCNSLTSINIPEGVTSIGFAAFMWCENLTAVHISNIEAWCKISFSENTSGEGSFTTNPLSYAHNLYLNGDLITNLVIPEGVTNIGYQTFYNFGSLTSITLPKSVTSIGDYAFTGCSNLTEITILDGVTSIGSSAFSGCSSLTAITLPEGVTSIGKYAFSGCSSLTDITLPEGVTSIGNGAFGDCSSLTSITLPKSVTSIGGYAFKGCSNLTEITIPDGVTMINSQAFYSCSSLTTIVLPGSVSYISNEAFAGCPELLDVYCYAESVPSTENNAFNGSYPEYVTLHVPTSALADYKATDPWSSFGKFETMSIAVTSITLSQSSDTITEGESLTLTAMVAPSNADDQSISWSSSNPSIATVDNMGKVTAIAPGTATITANANDGSGVSAQCEVTVNELILGKCATPTISYTDGKVVLTCATEGAKVITTVTANNDNTFDTLEFDYIPTQTFTAYATKEHYENSDTVTLTICWVPCDEKHESEETSILTIPAKPVLIQCQGGVITLSGLAEGTEVAVVTTAGTAVATATATNGTATLTTGLEAGSIAIVKIGNYSIKVAIK